VTTPTIDSWRRPHEDHQATVAEFVAAAGALTPEQWRHPVALDKWSPSQLAEHVRLTYEVFATELAGGQGLRVRTSWWMRTYLRLRYLRHLLRTGLVPRDRVPAPRAVRPGPGPFEQGAVLEGIRNAARRFEAQLHSRWHSGGGVITHHLFGKLSPSQALRFAAVHTRHHRAQLPTPAAQPPN
jgi:uncharacterized damage-inducible protein DinB